MINVRFASVSFFQPREASGLIVQAQDIETGDWYFHPGPPGSPFFDYPEAATFAKRVALRGSIDETKWWSDCPINDFEAAERKNLI